VCYASSSTGHIPFYAKGSLRVIGRPAGLSFIARAAAKAKSSPALLAFMAR